MPRPRRPRPKADRDHKAAYRRRDERARALGYRNYYDYRVHRHGRIAAGLPGAAGAERTRLRGHAGRADFLSSLGEGDLILMPYGLLSVEFDPAARGGRGAYREIVKTVVYAASGRERTFTLRNLTRDELLDTIEEEQARGAVFSPSPSLDQRRLVSDDESVGGY